MHDARATYIACNADQLHIRDGVRPRGIHIKTVWGKEILRLCETILLAFLQADRRLVNTTPDNIFPVIGFVSGLLTTIKFFLLKKIGMELSGSSDVLLSRTMDLLCDISFSDDHVAKRCAHLIHTMITVWEKGHRDYVSGLPVDLPAPPTTAYADGVADMHHSDAPSQLDLLGSLPTSHISSVPKIHYDTSEFDASFLKNVDMFEDVGFWSQLLDAQEHSPEEYWTTPSPVFP